VSLSRRCFIGSTAAGAVVAVTGAAREGRAEEPESRDDCEMITIPAGPVVTGTTREQAEALSEAHEVHVSWFDGEFPAREVPVPTFKIDRYPVTCAQFQRFIEDMGRELPQRFRRRFPAGRARCPAYSINWVGAAMYAEWAGKRLPTEVEWEKAARGPDGRMWPWGDRWDGSRCTWNEGDRPGGAPIAPVDAHPAGASPYGVMDMVGNVAEWCADKPSRSTAMMRGGSWRHSQPYILRPAYRGLAQWLQNGQPWCGFRCAV
jgi:formylglycine-generating enzyme required for sulfatase activity